MPDGAACRIGDRPGFPGLIFVDKKENNEYRRCVIEVTDVVIYILCAVAGLAVGGVVAGLVAFRAGVSHRKKTAEAAIGSAEAEAERIVSDAKAAAESKKKDLLIGSEGGDPPSAQ